MNRPCKLRCEYMENPQSVDTRNPRLSWVADSDRRNDAQTAYQILVANRTDDLEKTTADVWDSSKVTSAQSLHVEYQGGELLSKQTYFWRVRTWDSQGNPTEYSEPAQWRMGLLCLEEWKASWIHCPEIGAGGDLNPAQFLRKVFHLDRPVERAVLFITARGLYRCWINGTRVGSAEITPDWSDYGKRIFYDSHDVSGLLRDGENALGIILGDGWYAGHVGFHGEKRHYGDIPEVLAQLTLVSPAGSETIVVTDEHWKCSTGPILYSDFLQGEYYDARLEMPGWSTVDFDDARWAPAVSRGMHKGVRLAGRCAPAVEKIEEIKPISATRRNGEELILDFGQNISGWVKLRIQAQSGTSVQLRHGEILNTDGSLYTENLRTARATDTYVCSGRGVETWEPHFTYHGFRYVSVCVSGQPDLLETTAVVVHSALPQTGFFSCSNDLVNKLWLNILWSQKDNYFSVPTDCPQRDERLGWTADAQVFARTACFNMDAAAFLSLWLINLRDAQSAEGAFPDVAPRVAVKTDGAPGWGDAGVILPWILFQYYGDTRVLEESYESMTRWMDYIGSSNPDHVRRNKLNKSMGDWVSYNSLTPPEVLATAYWACDADIMAGIAGILGKTEDSHLYKELSNRVKAAFNRAFVREDSTIHGDTQTCYALALSMDILPEEKRSEAAGHLVRGIELRGGHLSTGFVGTAHLLQALSQNGYAEVAYRLLANTTVPSWGYMIRKGATTIWERWDSLDEEGHVFDPQHPTFIHPEFGPIAGMNSFNHFAFGSVGEWIYRTLGGISPSEKGPGFAHVCVHPVPGGDIRRAETRYESVHGTVHVAWKTEGEILEIEVRIPCGVHATVRVPADRQDVVLESNVPVQQNGDLRAVQWGAGFCEVEIGSGEYHFRRESCCDNVKEVSAAGDSQSVGR